MISGLNTLGDHESATPDTDRSVCIFTVKLYSSKRQEDLKRYADIEDVGELRWELYSKRQEEGESLPPTYSALKFHTKRANYVSLFWKRSVHDFMTSIPDCSVDQGWEIEERTKLLQQTFFQECFKIAKNFIIYYKTLNVSNCNIITTLYFIPNNF